ncbi:MAG TPA: non-homologous end-joining DNA ligase [Methylomirabilota bacterium]|nr:non-homologous end-joining DNA ligase [Methylomirabilota bacterium]
MPRPTPPAIPRDQDSVVVRLGARDTTLTNLRKAFWPELGLTKGDLLRYYLAVAPALLPHLHDRAMVMKRYPDGAAGPFFFMKRAPEPRPDWIETCAIAHRSGSVIHFPVIQDVLALLWVVNLGCIDLNPWYARCDDTDRPDFLHFDLDPTPGATLAQIADAAHRVREVLAELGMAPLVKTTGSRGLHVYVPILRGPTQKQVWTLAKALALELARRHPDLITAEYRVARRPRQHVIVDYNQNAWGRTLASVYSVRPTPHATVSTPLRWDEVNRELRMEAFRIDTVPARLRERGDLWKPLLGTRRYDIGPLLAPAGRWLSGQAPVGPGIKAPKVPSVRGRTGRRQAAARRRG